MASSSSSMPSLAAKICDQIAAVFARPTHPHPPPLDVLVAELSSAAAHGSGVFLFGVGREGLMLRALCMRLAHLGIRAHYVSDVTVPPISAGDLLVASAGPGGFATVDAICGEARKHGARVVVLTAQPETGSCVAHASAVAYVPAQTMADDCGGDKSTDTAEESRRPVMLMGSVYEGALFVLFEMVVYELGEALGQTVEAIRSRHTNLE